MIKVVNPFERNIAKEDDISANKCCCICNSGSAGSKAWALLPGTFNCSCNCNSSNANKSANHTKAYNGCY